LRKNFVLSFKKKGAVMMKKIVLGLLAAAFMAGGAFAGDGENGEINVKAGLGLINSVSGDYTATSSYGSFDISDYIDDETPDIGVDLSAEYLYKINDIVKVGAGLTYFIKREWDSKLTPPDSPVNLKYKNDITALPIYVTVQISPIEQVREAYFKANIGYTIYSDMNGMGDHPGAFGENISNFKDSISGGLYFGVGAGYEFAFGLIVEALYESFKCEKEYSFTDEDGDSGKFNMETSYSQVGLKVGYKFKI
jgi:hypothetical protein